MAERGKLTAHEAVLGKPLSGNRVECDLCWRRCVIPDHERGYCYVRYNEGGKLYTEAYGVVTALNLDPIEKKPFYHFLPGTTSLSISTVSCNFRCKFCQNWELSYFKELKGLEISPEEIARVASDEGARSVSYTYNEPTIFVEYAIDTAKEAKKRGLKNTFVTNGYMTPEAVDYVKGYIDAMTVGIKGSLNPEFYRRMMAVPDAEVIKQTLLAIKQARIHLEMTDLLVTKYGDDMASLSSLARWVVDNIGDDTPFHVLRFFPDAQLRDVPPTSVELLRRARDIAKKEGLKYVYVGNVPGEDQNTYCPYCGNLLVRREGFSSQVVGLNDGHCSKCGANIPIVLG
jgi:pyruvate formate lyase activating enzyme